MTVTENQLTLMPEWADIEAVVLAWPHADTDWSNWLSQAQDTFITLINAINRTGTAVVLLCREKDIEHVKTCFRANQRILLFVTDYNDTWTRDYVFLTCGSANGNVPVSFEFNGWGQKFNAEEDNQVNRALAKICVNPMVFCSTVLEGGAIEIDENQTLLTTSSCLLNPARNGEQTLDYYDPIFEQYLGSTKSISFSHGHLEGDDTDGHIDTLVRFTPLMGIVMQHARNRMQDPHFESLYRLQLEIQANFPNYQIYELPLPYVINDNGERLPASYANYLICNKHILAPVYNQPEDEDAIAILKKAYPNYSVVPIDCSVLIQQFGSLHCVTMQVPEGTIKPDIIAQIDLGISRI